MQQVLAAFDDLNGPAPDSCAARRSLRFERERPDGDGRREAERGALAVSEAINRRVVIVVSCRIWATRFFKRRRRKKSGAGTSVVVDLPRATTSSASR